MFCFIGDIVQSVVGQIVSQMTNIEDNIIAPICEIVNDIKGGMWVGKGADAFVKEMGSVVLPMIANLIACLAGFNDGIGKASSIIDQLEDAVSGLFGGLGDMLGGIF